MKRLFLLLLSLLLVACQGNETTPTEVVAPPETTAATELPPATALPTLTSAVIVTEQTEPTTDAPPTDAPPTDTPLPPTEVPPPPTATTAPDPAPPTEVIIEMDGAQLPPGFSVIEYAALPRPTGLTFDDQGRLWATNHVGEIWVFDDADDDGRADFEQQYAFGFIVPVGIAVHPDNGDVYISQEGKITIARDTNGDLSADQYESIVSDLPFGLHKNNNLKFGPDGMLYMGVGSTCNECVEVDARSATVMRFDTTTGAGEVIATGLRNVYDIAFHPTTGQLFATENGRDDLGQNQPPEELNLIVEGADYGWPDCWGTGGGSNCEGTAAPTANFEAHSSINGVTFYTGDRFPRLYRGDLYTSNFGSWQYPLQMGIQRVELTDNGNGGFTANTSWFLRADQNLLPLIEGPDGALYFGTYDINDPSIGAIYRISYGVP